LRARLCDLVGCDGSPAQDVSWAIEDITLEVPEEDSHRITRMLLQRDTLTPAELAIRHLMTHPSGMVYDARRGGVWVSTAAYAPDSYSALLLVRPDRIGQGQGVIQRDIRVSDHIGALSLIRDRYLV